MAKAKVKAQQFEPNYIVMPLLALALASNLFLYMVAYTQSSFDRQAIAFPAIIETPTIVSLINDQVDAIQNDVTASWNQMAEITKPAVVAFLGLEDYKFGTPVRTSLSTRSSEDRMQVAEIQISGISDSQGAVLGIMLVNPDYANEFASQ
jgi:hypothetical protein